MASEAPTLPLSEIVRHDSPITYGVVKPGEEDPDGIPFIRSGDVGGGSIDTTSLRTITSEVSKQYRRTLLEGGEILVSLVGNPGQASIVPDCLRGANIARQVALLRVDPTFSRDYIYYFLTSRQGRSSLLAYSKGSVQQVINLGDLQKVEIPIPPIKHQKSIAYILGTLDDKIELNRKTNETLEGIAKVLFRSWFVDFDPVRAKAEGRPTGLPEEISNLFPDSFEESELGEIPSGWSIKKIGDVVARLPVGQKFDKKTVSQKGMVPVLDQSSDGIIGFHDQAPGVLASESDPLFTFANHTCSMRFMMESFSVIQNVFPLKGKDVSTDWLYQATLGKQMITEYKGHYPDLVDREIVVPNRGLDLVFGGIFRSFARSQLVNKKQSLTLERLRDALLPRLISGELRVPDAEKMLEEAGV